MASNTFAAIFAQEMRLKGVTERRDIDQLTVAQDLGVSPATVSRWKTGVVPEDDTLARIAAYFGVTRAWLRYGQEPREAPRDTPPEPPAAIPATPSRPPLAPDPRPSHARGRAKKKAVKRRAGGDRK